MPRGGVVSLTKVVFNPFDSEALKGSCPQAEIPSYYRGFFILTYNPNLLRTPYIRAFFYTLVLSYF